MNGITTRIEELGVNLNFALGELSVATHDFRHMATGLTKALDNANKNATAVPKVEGN